MFSDWVRNWTHGIRTSVARLLGRWGVSPNFLTLLGYVLHLPAAYALARGQLQLGGILVLLASLLDSLDGSVAREMGQTTTFGAFFDSTIDRYSEATILFGLLLWCARLGAQQQIALIYLALFGSLMVSYTRARAEGVGIACKEGLFTRFERVVLIVVCLLARQVGFLLWGLVILTHVTALQRIYLVWQATRKNEPPAVSS